MAREGSTPSRQVHLDLSPMRRRRRELELSQRALAEHIGVHSFTIHRLERGQGDPKASLLIAVGRALGVPWTSLFVIQDGPRP